MLLSAPADGNAWALYSFGGIEPEDTPDELVIALAGSRPDVLWVGLSDYGAGAWQWQAVAPQTSVVTVSLTGLEQPVDAGVFHVLVVTYGGHEATLGWLRLELAGSPPPPPSHLVVDKGPAPGQFTLSWVKPAGADSYKVYRDDTVSVYADAWDVAEWTDTATDGEDHTYWLRSVNQHGAGALSQPAYGRQGPWQLQLIDPDGRYSTSLAVVDGKPVIAYVAEVVDLVNYPYPRFARAKTATPRGPDDWVISEWNEWGEAVNHTHIPWVADVDDKPAFTIDNRYYRALTQAPSSRQDWEVHLFDAEADIPALAPLIEYNGAAHMVYIDYDRDVLRFARALSAAPSDGEDWNISTIDEFDIINPGGSCLAEIDNLPAVSYGRRDGWEEPGDLCFAHATSPSPASSGDWQTHIVDDIPGYPAGAVETDLQSLANGKPAISYIESYAPDYIGLKFARSLVVSPTGTTDWVTHTVQADIADDGMSTSMRLVDGKPAICYFDGQGIKYAAAQVAEPSSSSDWVVETIFEGHVDYYKCLRIIAGQPAVSYCSSAGLFLLTQNE